jgi:hypothetical protein
MILGKSTTTPNVDIMNGIETVLIIRTGNIMSTEVAIKETTGTLEQVQIIPEMTIGRRVNTIAVIEMMIERFLEAEIALWTDIPGETIARAAVREEEIVAIARAL